MKINIARSAGFCFGVKRALGIAFQTAGKKDKVYMLGDIVHNEEVVGQIKKAGIRKIQTLGLGGGKILLIRAHGASRSIADAAARSGYKIVDATCPMVKEIHKIARDMEQKGYKIVIIGDKKHEEVDGIVGQLKSRALTIDSSKAIPFKTLGKIEKACVIVQSTQNLEKALKIVTAIRPYVKDLKFFNTVCHPTRMKQDEIRKMPRHNDVVLVIGSKTSANTKRLYEISRSLNRRTFWCQSKSEIRPEWFKGARSVGITAGASTPDSTISEVVTYIKKAAKGGSQGRFAKKIILICLLSTIPWQLLAGQGAARGPEEICDHSDKETFLFIPELNKDIIIFPGICSPKKADTGIRKILSTNDFSWASEVLDVGTGTGILGLIVLKHGAKRVVGTDINPAAVDNAAHNAKIFGYEKVFDARLVPIDKPQAYSVIKKNEKFDLIIASLPWYEGKPADMSSYATLDEGRVLLRSLIEGLLSHLTDKGKALIYIGGPGGLSLVFELAAKNGLRATVVDSGEAGNSGHEVKKAVIELKNGY